MSSLGNGQNLSTDVMRSAELDSNYFIRANQPIVVQSPLEIVSPDTTQEATLSVDNTGVLTLASDEIVFDPTNNFTIIVGDGNEGGGAGLQVKPATQTTGTGAISLYNGSASATPTYYSIYNASETAGGLTAGNLMTYGYALGQINQISDFTSDGSSATFGEDVVGGFSLSVNGSLGLSRVNDPIYNPVPATTVVTTVYTSGQTLNAGVTVVGAPLMIQPGNYQFQVALILSNAPGGTISLPAGGSISAVYQPVPFPTNLPNFSALNITTAMLTMPAVNSSNIPSFSSGIFTVTVAENYAIGLEVVGNYDFGTGASAIFQIVKFA